MRFPRLSCWCEMDGGRRDAKAGCPDLDGLGDWRGRLREHHYEPLTSHRDPAGDVPGITGPNASERKAADRSEVREGYLHGRERAGGLRHGSRNGEVRRPACGRDVHRTARPDGPGSDADERTSAGWPDVEDYGPVLVGLGLVRVGRLAPERWLARVYRICQHTVSNA